MGGILRKSLRLKRKQRILLHRITTIVDGARKARYRAKVKPFAVFGAKR